MKKDRLVELCKMLDSGTVIILTDCPNHIVIKAKEDFFEMLYLHDGWREMTSHNTAVLDCNCEFCNAIRKSESD